MLSKGGSAGNTFRRPAEGWHHAAVAVPARGSSILLWAVAVKLAAVLAFVLAASSHPAAPGLTAPREPGTPDTAWYLARGFDSNCYQRMAHEGWYDDFSICMPMGYPLAIRAVEPLAGGSAQLAAVLVSNACSLAALVVFLALARRYAGADSARIGPAVLLCACMPGLLAFGTVAYSEGPWILVTLLAWWAWLRAEGGGGPRAMRWLVVAALLAALSVQVRHAGVAFVAGLLLLEGLRVVAAGAGGPRRRALLEAGVVAALSALPTAGYFVFKYRVQDFGAVQAALFDSRLVPLGGFASLLAKGAPPENVAVLALGVPLALALLVRLWEVDRRLALVTGGQLLLALSVTGIGAQSVNRFTWALAPLALGALAVTDRVLLYGTAGVLFVLSLWCGIGHVLGTAAL
ncbi:MAG TPA: hypothetical protein VK824_09260 [Planctomycetota bacterium]|nr:hypothetical protein [Planctomycetota bacterium]